MKILFLILFSLTSFSFELNTGDVLSLNEEIKVPYGEALTISDEQATIKFSSESRFIIKSEQDKKVILLIEGSLDVNMSSSVNQRYEIQSESFNFQFDKFNGSFAMDESGIYIINFDSEPNLRLFEPNEAIYTLKRNSVLEFNYYDKPLISALPREQIKKIQDHYRNPLN